MKKLEWLAMLVIILFIASNFLSFFGSALISRLYSPAYVGTQSLILSLTTSIRSLLSIIVNLAVGIWLFIQAKHLQSTPWIWLLFGIVFGLIAAVLFFVIKLLESTSFQNATNDE